MELRTHDFGSWLTMSFGAVGYDILTPFLHRSRWIVKQWYIDSAKFKRYSDDELEFDTRADAMRWCHMHHMTGA